MKTLLSSFIILLPISGFAQHSFDVIKILDSHKVEGMERKLKGIHSTDERIINLDLFLKNPFDTSIKNFNILESVKYLDAIPLKNGTKKGNKKNDSIINIVDSVYILKDITDVASSVSSVSSGFSPTTQLIDATASLLVERTKQEITTAFYQNFKGRLNTSFDISLNDTDTIKVSLNTVFPNTHLLFVSQDYFQTPSFGQVWVTSFKKDIQQFSNSFKKIIDENKKLRDSDQGHFALVSFDIVDQINKGIHPKLVLERIANDYTNVEKYEIDKMVGLLNVLSENLTTNATGDSTEIIEKWITNSELKKLSSNQNKLLAGLVFQKLNDKQIFNSDELNYIQTNYIELVKLITSTQFTFSLIESKLVELKSAKNSKGTDTDNKQENYKFSEYINTIYGVVDETFESYSKLKNTHNYYQSSYYRDFKPLVTTILEFNTAISTKNYAETILISSQFLTKLFPNIKPDDKIIKNIYFYSNFMLDISNTIESQGDLKPVLEHYIMPVNSYRVKRLYGLALQYESSLRLYKVNIEVS
ncbi:hypothetical protein [Flavobacterium sp. SM2513]|uniref:hypothetical protein n=1 Tax=Flavobacterium sp. SM2513 TaxID=3424766 RepID=UPI003D7FB48C